MTASNTAEEAAQRVAAMEVFELARLADCVSPDSATSPGASFLDGVRRAVLDAVAYGQDRDDSIPEIADGAPSVYTHGRWQEFLDLAAYQEDPRELADGFKDMTDSAHACLYLIAERLASALWDELED